MSIRRDLARAAMPLARMLGSVTSVSGGLGSASIGRRFSLPMEAIDYQLAFRLIPTINFCVELYQTTISSTPLCFYAGKGDTKKEVERAPGNIAELWARPNTEDTGPDLIEKIVGSLQLQGNAYLFKEYGPGKTGVSLPRRLWVLNPLGVSPVLGPNGRTVVEFKVQEGFGPEQTIPRQQIIHFRRYDPDMGVLGLSRLSSLRLHYETMRDSARFMRAFYQRGGTTAGHYSTEQSLDPDEMDALKKDLHERVQGPEHAWEPVILPRKLKFERAGLTFAEMQFIESHGITKETVLEVFKTHPVLASKEVAAGLNSEIMNTAMMMLMRFGIFPEARRIALTLTEKLLSSGEFGSDLSCEFDFSNDPVLVDAWLKSCEAWSKASGGPVVTRAEARDRLALPDRTSEFPELDELLTPIGMTNEVGAGTTTTPPPTDPNPGTSPDPAAADANVSQARGYRDALRVKSDRTLTLYERRWRAETARIFRGQRNRVASALREQHLMRELGVRAIDVDLLVAKLEHPDDRRRAKRLLRGLIRDAGDAALAELASEIAFDLNAKVVSEWIDQKGATFITNINATTRDALRAELSAGTAASEDLGALVARVDAVFEGRRGNALTIARTETAPAYNFATTRAWTQSGVVSEKSWLTAGDDAVRDAHRTADGQQVPLDGDFIVDGEAMSYPGDPRGSAGNVINCRCTMVPVVRHSDTTESSPLPARIAARMNGSGGLSHARNGTTGSDALTVEEFLNGSTREH